MWTSLNKRIYLFIIGILVIGSISGIVFIIMTNDTTREIILLNINDYIQNIDNININNILIHLVILACIFLTSLFIIGLPLSLFFMYFNGFSIGFILTALFYIFGIRGIGFGLSYILITKGVFLFLLCIIINNIIKITKLLIENISSKKNNIDNLYRGFRKVIIIIGIILLNDVFLYYFGMSLVKLFNFLVI